MGYFFKGVSMKLADIVKFYEFLYQENPYALNHIYQREANLLSHNVDELPLKNFIQIILLAHLASKQTSQKFA